MSVGKLSKGRLDRLHAVMAGHVEHGEIPGLVALVCRRGEVHVEAIGGRDPIRRDTIFRIASLTKPVAAAAAMILVEECRLRLDELVDRLLPELADRRVLKRLDGPLDETVPARRPISLRDLLTLRMGFGYLMEASSPYPVLEAASAASAPGPSATAGAPGAGRVDAPLRGAPADAPARRGVDV
jgi:CubicO group peptidase (beta-lactamase class C family)